MKNEKHNKKRRIENNKKLRMGSKNIDKRKGAFVSIFLCFLATQTQTTVGSFILFQFIFHRPLDKGLKVFVHYGV